MLDLSEESYWEHVLLLQKDIRTTLTKLTVDVRAALSDPVDLTGLYMASHTRNYLRRILGVQGGSFGIAHRSSNEFKLVQWSFTGLPKELPQLRLPYLDKNLDKKSQNDDIGLSFVDLAFTSLRARQPLREDLKRGGKQYSVLPEFYSQLPPLGDNHLCVSGEEMQRREKGIDFLLCTAGEVAFFIWAWLWIRKLVSRGPGKQLVIKEDGIDTIRLPAAESTWATDFWRDEKGDYLTDPPTDVLFADFIDHLCAADDSASPLQVPEANLAAARRQWERIKAIESTTEDNLALACGLPQDRGVFRVSVSKLIECGLNLAKKQQARLKHPESMNWMDDVKRAISNLEVLKTLVRTEEVDLLELEQNLKYITIFALLKTVDNGEYLDVSRIYGCDSLQTVIGTLDLTGYKALTGLHELARFPIIHYYCLQLLYREPLEHLVLPVWKSFKYAETIKTGDGSENTNEFLTPDVVLALLSITPQEFEVEDHCVVAKSTSANPSLPSSPESSRRLSRDSHLLRIQGFMKVLANPLIDYGFYGSLVSMEQEAMGRSNAFHSIPDAFASSIDALEEHARECTQFTVPPGLYLAAYEAMLSAGKRPADIQKWSLRLPKAEKILEKQGICRSLFEYLLAPRGTVCRLGRIRLLRDNFPDLKRPTFEIDGKGRIPVEVQKDGSHEFLIALLVILLKEAYEHSVRAVRGNDQTPIVSVSIGSDGRSVTIANTCKDVDLAKFHSGRQSQFLREFMKKLAGWHLEDLRLRTPDQAIRVLTRTEAP